MMQSSLVSPGVGKHRAVCGQASARHITCAVPVLHRRGSRARPVFGSTKHCKTVCLAANQDSSSQFDVDAPRDDEERLELGPRDDDVGG